MNIWKVQLGEILSSVSLSKLTQSKQESASAIDVRGNFVNQDSEDDSDKFITLPPKFVFLILSCSFPRWEIRPCSGDFLPVVLLLSAGPHCLTLLTMASTSLSLPGFMPSYSPPALLQPRLHQPCSFPPQGLFMCCSHCLEGSPRFCLGHSLTPSSSLHKGHLLRVPYPDTLFKTVIHLPPCLQTCSLYLTLLFIAHFFTLNYILFINLSFSHCNVGLVGTS